MNEMADFWDWKKFDEEGELFDFSSDEMIGLLPYDPYEIVPDYSLHGELDKRLPDYRKCAAKLFYENEKQSKGNQEFQRILPAFSRLKEFADRACGGTNDLQYFNARAIGDAIRDCMILDDCVSCWKSLTPQELMGALDGMVYFYEIFPQLPLKAVILSFADQISARKDVLDFCEETLR